MNLLWAGLFLGAALPAPAQVHGPAEAAPVETTVGAPSAAPLLAPSGAAAPGTLLAPALDSARPLPALAPLAQPGPASASIREPEPPARTGSSLVDPSAAPEGGRAAAARALDYLRGLPKIRVLFTRAPGYGHQTATLSLVRRLRDLGYRGEIEGIYEDGEDYDTGRTFDPLTGDYEDGTFDPWTRIPAPKEPLLEEKLGRLIPEFEPFKGGDQTIPGLGLTLRRRSRFAVDRTPVPLALTGGADRKEDFARSYNADVFLRLGPFDWSGYSDQVYFKSGDSPVPLAFRGKPALVYAPKPESVDDSFFERIRPDNIPAAKAAGLRALNQRLADHDVLPAYGLSFFKERHLHQLLLAVARAQDERPELFKGRGVVIPLLLDVDDMLGKLVDKVERLENGPHETPPQPGIREANRMLSRRLKSASVADPDLDRRLAELGEDDILLLKTGPVPPAYFEKLFASATLPPLLEGKNALNLARLLGIPFLPFREASYEGLLSFVPEEGGARERIRDLLFSGPGEARSVAASLFFVDYQFERLAAFIAEAMTPGSALRNMFSAARLRQDDYGQDKLIQAVDQALSLLDRRAQESGAPK